MAAVGKAVRHRGRKILIQSVSNLRTKSQRRIFRNESPASLRRSAETRTAKVEHRSIEHKQRDLRCPIASTPRPLREARGGGVCGSIRNVCGGGRDVF